MLDETEAVDEVVDSPNADSASSGTGSFSESACRGAPLRYSDTVPTCCVQCSAGKIPPGPGSGSWPAGLADFDLVGLLGAGGVFGLVGLGGLFDRGGLFAPGGLFAGGVSPAMTLFFKIPTTKRLIV